MKRFRLRKNLVTSGKKDSQETRLIEKLKKAAKESKLLGIEPWIFGIPEGQFVDKLSEMINRRK